MENIAVSIVVPVYNVEHYLCKCLESIVNQTLENIEIICVDDGSTDFCPQMLDGYARKDGRIKVIHKPNSGYGHTMNTGILAAGGDYIGIVESDDYIMPGMMEALYLVAQRCQVDFVRSDYVRFWGTGSERTSSERVKLSADNRLYNKVLDKEGVKALCRGSVANCTGIYRRDFLLGNQIFHNETPGASYQDLGFFFQIMMKAQNGYLLDESFYQYRQDNPGSSIASRKKVFCICDEFEFIYKKLKKEAVEDYKNYLSVFQLIRLQNTRFHVKRMAEEYRLPFLKKMLREFELSDSLGELDLSYFEKWEKDELSRMRNDSAEYLEALSHREDKLIERTVGYRQLIIYGAGQTGSEVYEILRGYMDRYEEICFAVTDAEGEEKSKKGIQVWAIDQLKKYCESAVVVLAVTRKYRDDMLAVLKSLGFENIVEYE